MCLQCMTESETILEFAPGWFLFKAKKPYKEWTKWAIGQINNPDFFFAVDPIPNPDPKGRRKKLHEDEEEFLDRLVEFQRCLNCDPSVGYSLIQSLKKVGFKPSIMSFSYFLFNKLGELLNEKKNNNS